MEVMSIQTDKDAGSKDGETFAFLLASLSDYKKGDTKKDSKKSVGNTISEGKAIVKEENHSDGMGAEYEPEDKKTPGSFADYSPSAVENVDGQGSSENLKDISHHNGNDKKISDLKQHKPANEGDEEFTNGILAALLSNQEEAIGKQPNEEGESKNEIELIDGHPGEKRKRGNDDDWRPGAGKKKFKGQKKSQGSPPLPSMSYKSRTLDAKLSFQEAAVRVLAEQRERGIYALSTRRIWELISQAGLVDTKCKTPVSSLSSRITEDVRTKGNKSVFLRVGEGLYTLRKGLKKADLEKFLNTKYPHMAHALKEAEESYKSENDDDGNRSFSENEKELEELLPMEKEVEISENEKVPFKPEDCQWLGLPLKTKKNGDIYYSAVKIDKNKYRVGDCAYFTPNSDDQAPYIGQITKLWHSRIKASPDSPYEDMRVQCVWFFYPEDTHCGRTKKNHKQEIFLSDLTDVNTVESLLAPVEVVTFTDFNKRLHNTTNKKELEDVFFCRYLYNENLKEFYPVDSSPEEMVHKEEVIPNNWPKDIEFNQQLMFQNCSEVVKNKLSVQTLPHVELKKLNEEKLTVFASKDIESHTIIGEYTGFIDVDENDKMAVDKTTSRKPIFKDEEITAVVDASRSGNEMRFLRSCDPLKGETPNVRLVPTPLNGKWHLLVVASLNIKAGQELLA